MVYSNKQQSETNKPTQETNNMMHSEFIRIADVPDVPAKDYELIELVYNYHPAIEDKQDIAHIYNAYGMATIKDMVPRAEKLEAIEQELMAAKQEVERLTNLYREASK